MQIQCTKIESTALGELWEGLEELWDSYGGDLGELWEGLEELWETLGELWEDLEGNVSCAMGRFQGNGEWTFHGQWRWPPFVANRRIGDLST